MCACDQNRFYFNLFFKIINNNYIIIIIYIKINNIIIQKKRLVGGDDAEGSEEVSREAFLEAGRVLCEQVNSKRRKHGLSSLSVDRPVLEGLGREVDSSGQGVASYEQLLKCVSNFNEVVPQRQAIKELTLEIHSHRGKLEKAFQRLSLSSSDLVDRELFIAVAGALVDTINAERAAEGLPQVAPLLESLWAEVDSSGEGEVGLADLLTLLTSLKGEGADTEKANALVTELLPYRGYLIKLLEERQAEKSTKFNRHQFNAALMCMFERIEHQLTLVHGSRATKQFAPDDVFSLWRVLNRSGDGEVFFSELTALWHQVESCGTPADSALVKALASTLYAYRLKLKQLLAFGMDLEKPGQKVEGSEEVSREAFLEAGRVLCEQVNSKRRKHGLSSLSVDRPVLEGLWREVDTDAAGTLTFVCLVEGLSFMNGQTVAEKAALREHFEFLPSLCAELHTYRGGLRKCLLSGLPSDPSLSIDREWFLGSFNEMIEYVNTLRQHDDSPELTVSRGARDLLWREIDNLGNGEVRFDMIESTLRRLGGQAEESSYESESSGPSAKARAAALFLYEFRGRLKNVWPEKPEATLGLAKTRAVITALFDEHNFERRREGMDALPLGAAAAETLWKCSDVEAAGAVSLDEMLASVFSLAGREVMQMDLVGRDQRKFILQEFYCCRDDVLGALNSSSSSGGSTQAMNRPQFSLFLAAVLNEINMKKWRAREPPLQVELDELGRIMLPLQHSEHTFLDITGSSVECHCSADSIFREIDTEGFGRIDSTSFLLKLDNHRTSDEVKQADDLARKIQRLKDDLQDFFMSTRRAEYLNRMLASYQRQVTSLSSGVPSAIQYRPVTPPRRKFCAASTEPRRVQKTHRQIDRSHQPEFDEVASPESFLFPEEPDEVNEVNSAMIGSGAEPLPLEQDFHPYYFRFQQQVAVRRNELVRQQEEALKQLEKDTR
eukprot:GHVR01004457.1.p1 GENE.GHVR01004457.1~~GHVR01004457.1.p1  ORF type:complete len:951 (+),score=195.11 GHVR01004457.1:267-3119(+)